LSFCKEDGSYNAIVFERTEDIEIISKIPKEDCTLEIFRDLRGRRNIYEPSLTDLVY
jgi:hypothetical protein